MVHAISTHVREWHLQDDHSAERQAQCPRLQPGDRAAPMPDVSLCAGRSCRQKMLKTNTMQPGKWKHFPILGARSFHQIKAATPWKGIPTSCGRHSDCFA